VDPAVIFTASLEPADSMLISLCQSFTITSAQKIISNVFVPKPQARYLADWQIWQGLAAVQLAIGVMEPRQKQVLG